MKPEILVHFGVLHAKCGEPVLLQWGVVGAALLSPEPEKVTCPKCLRLITRKLRKAE